eukprot:CAMPEP_0196997008 /NCGR_PEP_ID=MMETSP1380-20130617/2752_1 /TAXON_ID=5936 /ORGANISM="Euplotes crassus, Strain CT5" /LENGTH=54 /DNA_ID=CAMNT_0042413133 /DNA_START=196 /DNA_END=360 /DNA_ORIENTATION=-
MKNFKSEQLPDSSEYYLVKHHKRSNLKENRINGFLDSMKVRQIHLDAVLKAVKA